MFALMMCRVQPNYHVTHVIGGSGRLMDLRLRTRAAPPAALSIHQGPAGGGGGAGGGVADRGRGGGAGGGVAGQGEGVGAAGRTAVGTFCNDVSLNALSTIIGTLNTTFEIENINVNVEFFLHTLIFPYFGSASAFAKHF